MSTTKENISSFKESNTTVNKKDYNFWALFLNEIPTRISIMKAYDNEFYKVCGIGALNYLHLNNDFPTLENAKSALTDTFSEDKLFLVAYCAKHLNHFVTDENNLPNKNGFICNECQRIKNSFYIYPFMKCKQIIKDGIITFNIADNEYKIPFLIKKLITLSDDLHKQEKERVTK